MKLSQRSIRRAQLEQLQGARAELAALRGEICRAEAIFNRTADPELLEAVILEIGALQTRYNRRLRELKDRDETPDRERNETRADISDSCHSAGRRGGAAAFAAEAAAKAH